MATDSSYLLLSREVAEQEANASQVYEGLARLHLALVSALQNTVSEIWLAEQHRERAQAIGDLARVRHP